jgi:pathogenesis-related protein 1
MGNAANRLLRITPFGLIFTAALSYWACDDQGVGGGSQDGAAPDPNADLAMSGEEEDMRGSPLDMTMTGPPEGNPTLNGITAQHNMARAAVSPVPTTPLPAMTWNATVAAAAQAWANGCKYDHNPTSPYGENIFASTGGSTPAAVVGDWVSEKSNYNYGANTCSGTCGHYTQVVWRNSIRLGCGVRNCTTGSPFSGGGNWQFWVCNYDPPGNVGTARPY